MYIILLSDQLRTGYTGCYFPRVSSNAILIPPQILTSIWSIVLFNPRTHQKYTVKVVVAIFLLTVKTFLMQRGIVGKNTNMATSHKNRRVGNEDPPSS